jgi:Fe-S cluster assembly iron-binding protein IscA
MENIISQLDFILPAAMVIMIAVYMLNKVLNHDHQRRVFEYKKATAKEMVSLRMQAYERLALFLERMQPSNLLVRVQIPNMKCKSLHAALIKTIRSEYDHNMSQQVYVSDKAWLLINKAKDQLLEVINEQVRSVPPDGDALELGKLVIEASLSEHKWLIDEALETLKKELRDNY